MSEPLPWITQLGPMKSQGPLKKWKREAEEKVRTILFEVSIFYCWQVDGGRGHSQATQAASRCWKKAKDLILPQSLQKGMQPS